MCDKAEIVGDLWTSTVDWSAATRHAWRECVGALPIALIHVALPTTGHHLQSCRVLPRQCHLRRATVVNAGTLSKKIRAGERKRGPRLHAGYAMSLARARALLCSTNDVIPVFLNQRAVAFSSAVPPSQVGTSPSLRNPVGDPGDTPETLPLLLS